MRLDICTTATLRPGILDRTLASFRKHLFREGLAEYRYIINVDPAGEGCPAEDVLAVARRHFDEVVFNAPDEPNFPRAVRWCWMQLRSEYMFQLEDDWELLEPIDLSDMARIMDERPALAQLRLSMFPGKGTPERPLLRQWNRYIDWNGEFFEVPRERKRSLGYCGHPAIMRSAFIERVRGHLVDRWCPEKTLKGHSALMRHILAQWEFGVYHQPFARPTIRDIGRRWRAEQGWYKHRGHSFHRWIPLPEGMTERQYANHLRDKGES